jgi:CBS domain containing-hemolysin-like protein
VRLDNVVGIFYVKDAIAKVTERKESLEDIPVRAVMRPPYFVPESKRISDLLREFRAQRIQIAIVLDEYGGTAGLITIEDILEEIVGEIDSEHDRKTEGPVKVSSDGVIEVNAKMRVAEVNERFGLSLEENEDYDTLGGFVFSHLGRVPPLGDVFITDGVEFTVLKADARRIGRLRLRILSREPNKVQ